MGNEFYLACFRDNVGSNVSFHAKDGKGYVTDIDKAHVYTKEQAQKAWNNGREFDQPISVSHVKALTVWKVDCQYIDGKASEGVLYVAHKSGSWDGNDVYWFSQSGHSTDFAKAQKLTAQEAEILNGTGGYIISLHSDIDSIKRRTFDFNKFNRRKMVQGVGLITPEHVKRHRRRVSSGKTRFNCPSCGKINWQFNPYDFEGCSDIFCDEG